MPALPEVVYSTRPHATTEKSPEGVLVYVRTAQGNDALAWMDRQGQNVTESQFAILRAAECAPTTPALPRAEGAWGRHIPFIANASPTLLRRDYSQAGQERPAQRDPYGMFRYDK